MSIHTVEEQLRREIAHLRQKIAMIHIHHGAPLRDRQRRELIEAHEREKKALLEEMRRNEEVAKQTRLERDALHHIYCSGCERGTHRLTPNTLTEQELEQAFFSLLRARTWMRNHLFRNRDKDPGRYEAFKSHLEKRQMIFIPWGYDDGVDQKTVEGSGEGSSGEESS